MQTIHLNNATITIPLGSIIQMTPASYVEGESMVTYVTDTASFTVPRRAVTGANFLASQLTNDMADVSGDRVNLADNPMFGDSFMFSLLLDFLNRRLEGPATLRTADMSLTRPQWASLVELERFVFYEIDRNPYWTGISGQDFVANGTVCEDVFQAAFNVRITPDELTVKGPNGFALTVDLEQLTKPQTRPVSLLAGNHFGHYMEFPFPCDFVNSFFIPHTAISCIIKRTRTVCEGVLHSDGTLRIEPINAMAFQWFHFEISPRFPCTAEVYGA
jgi:hypothetical protein